MSQAVAAPTAVPAAAEEAKGGKLKLIIIAVVVLAVAGYGAMTFLGGGGDADPAAIEMEPEEGAVVTIAQMTTSLSGPGTHFVRLEFGAVLDATADPMALEEKFPLMKDAALSVLMGFDADTLRTVEGADQLRTALNAEAQEVYPEGEVLRIVLTDLLVQ